MTKRRSQKTTAMTRLFWGLLLGLLLAPAPARAQSDEVVYYHTDAIGSVRMITDATGAVVGRYDYLPFGEPWPTTPPSPADVRQFAGKERDAETGLDYFGARYYRSSSGRFTTVDPSLDIQKALLDPQLWNRYSYVTNNPLQFRDPDGRQREFLDQDIRALMARQITIEEYNARIQARGMGAAAGALIVAGPTVWRTAVGCLLSPSCQSSAIAILEGAAGAPPRVTTTQEFEVTAHGAARIAGQGATRGGTLGAVEITSVRGAFDAKYIANVNGATALVAKTANGRYNVVIEGDSGKYITSFRNLDQKSLHRMAKKYDWEGFEYR
ncbi:MAG: RHS repeat-associated core domain-containing protein [Vicinamibacterales bacterium]